VVEKKQAQIQKADKICSLSVADDFSLTGKTSLENLNPNYLQGF
jgi:hypothetical protein